MAPLDRPSQVVPNGGEVVGVPSAFASSQPDAVRLVMGLLRAGVPLSLLADLSSRSGPDSAAIFRAEVIGGAGSPLDGDPGLGGV
jgi:outer membrane receptor protein involved in Fe transport